MRSDHISGWLVKLWLLKHAPHLADGWDFEPDPAAKAVADRLIELVPSSPQGFASQNVLARTAIEAWGLDKVALVGGGLPTPLLPTPDQIGMFTDASDAVLQDAAQAGYNLVKVDINSIEDLQKLRGMHTVIATGLMLYLPDPAVTALFERLGSVGIEMVLYNQVNRNAPAEIIDAYNKLGFKLNFRNPDETATLLPPDWAIAEVQHVPDFVAQAREIGHMLGDQPPMNDFYRVVRRTPA